MYPTGTYSAYLSGTYGTCLVLIVSLSFTFFLTFLDSIYLEKED
jgi:hypothetical protein